MDLNYVGFGLLMGPKIPPALSTWEDNKERDKDKEKEKKRKREKEKKKKREKEKKKKDRDQAKRSVLHRIFGT